MLEPNLQKKFLLNDFSNSHLSTILSNIDSADPMVANTWLETLLDLLKVLPKDTIISKIFPFAITKGQRSQSLQSKLAAIKILSSICYFLDNDKLLEDLLPLVRSLSQDEEIDVRVATCSLFNLIYVKLDSQFLESGYFVLLVGLFQDQSLVVRNAIFTICSDMISLFYNEQFMMSIDVLFKDHIEAAIEFEPKLLPQVSKNLCVYASANKDSASTADKMWYIDCFVKIARLTEKNIIHPDSVCLPSEIPLENDLHSLYLQCRSNLASNFDYIAKLSSSISRVNLLCPFLENFALDSHCIVRQRIAEKLGQIAPCFKDHSSLLFDVFNRLLKDSSIEVLKSLVPQIADVLRVLNEAKVIGRTIDSKQTEEICKSLIQCELKIFSETLSWQLYENFTEQCASFPKHFPSSIVYSCFCKLFAERMTQCRALPSRLACTRTLLIFLRHNDNPKQCNEIRRQLIDLSYSDNFYERMLYVKTCSTIIDLFSSFYFNSYFLPSIFRLAGDKVANIRLAVVFLLPRIITVMQLNKSSFDPLENVLAKLRKDFDSEIRYQVELLDSTSLDLLPSSVIKENENKLEEEEALFRRKDTAEVAIINLTVAFSDLSLSSEPKKNRWAVLSRSSKTPVNGSKATSVISANSNRFPLADSDMEFMIDAGVPFSKTVSSRIPSISHKPSSEHYDSAHPFPNCSYIPIISTSISPSYQFSPLAYVSSNCSDQRYSDIDTFNHFSKVFARPKLSLVSGSNYFDHDPKFASIGHVQYRHGLPPAEKVTIKSYSSIPKSKVFKISSAKNDSLFNFNEQRKPKSQPLDRPSSNVKTASPASNKNGSNSFSNSNRDMLLSSGSYYSKGRPKVHLFGGSPLGISFHGPSTQSTSQSYTPISYFTIQDPNLNHPHSRYSVTEPQETNLNAPLPRFGSSENMNRQKKYSSRLPVRSTKKDSRNGSQ
ncbi:serine/threonine-protein phosphatase 4 regulatory subunit 4 isoform X2 [Bemisia tabaci]|uniref:serine/threonine-protein phosphatase 4 regulatory subunit 4 isoform X2 n=1 Tax=Bemisia tabaci TaxID=7038 RepID=UPI003B280202